MLFDSHAHYNDRKFDEDRHKILSSMPDNNVGYIMNAADSMQSVEKILQLCDRYPFLYGSAGVHPENAGSMTVEDLQKLSEYAQDERVYAIGEIGLDYYYDDVPHDVQKKWFSAQLELAVKTGLPVIIHDREAHGDCMDILKAFSGIEGVMHCYSGSAEMAKELVNMGMYIGIGGVLTFKNAKKLRQAAEVVPMERILLETDCPYLAPEPFRGQRNSSLMMYRTAEVLAELKGISVEEVEKITCENAKALYKIKD